jgi:F0F1-type ATP synthase membrane subunit b/b'
MLIERQKNQARHAVKEGAKEEAAAAASALGGDEVQKAFEATY